MARKVSGKEATSPDLRWLGHVMDAEHTVVQVQVVPGCSRDWKMFSSPLLRRFSSQVSDLFCHVTKHKLCGEAEGVHEKST